MFSRMYNRISSDEYNAIIGTVAMSIVSKMPGDRIYHLQNLAEHRNKSVSQLIAEIITDHLDDNFCNDNWLGDDAYPGIDRLRRESQDDKASLLSEYHQNKGVFYGFN